MNRMVQQPFKRKLKKTTQPLFSSIHKKTSFGSLSSSPGHGLNLIRKYKSSVVHTSPNQPVRPHKKHSFQAIKGSSEYGIYIPSVVTEKKQLGFSKKEKIKKRASLQQIMKSSRKNSLKTKDTHFLNSSRQSNNSSHDKTEKYRNYANPLGQKTLNSHIISKKNGLQSKNSGSQIHAYIEYYDGNEQKYKNLYLESEKKVKKLLKKAEEQKKKSERVKQLYKEKIRQLKKQKEERQANIGHLYWYENRDQFIPDSVIVQKTIELDCSEFTKSKIDLELSVESR